MARERCGLNLPWPKWETQWPPLQEKVWWSISSGREWLLQQQTRNLDKTSLFINLKGLGSIELRATSGESWIEVAISLQYRSKICCQKNLIEGQSNQTRIIVLMKERKCQQVSGIERLNWWRTDGHLYHLVTTLNYIQLDDLFSPASLGTFWISGW